MSSSRSICFAKMRHRNWIDGCRRDGAATRPPSATYLQTGIAETGAGYFTVLCLYLLAYTFLISRGGCGLLMTDRFLVSITHRSSTLCSTRDTRIECVSVQVPTYLSTCAQIVQYRSQLKRHLPAGGASFYQASSKSVTRPPDRTELRQRTISKS